MSSPTDFRSELDAAVGVLRVDRDNVLQLRAGILAEADRLAEDLRVAQRECRVGLCGGDPVSPEAAAAFNSRIDGWLQHCARYIEALRASARTLDDSARRYGYTETEIADSFRTVG
ncbi:hypothetical protein [Pseudonocardia sp.]|uniref:WXG100 family type VII secretion target n=1 Tax=Pseudonocardia sp. TaxID=60912 RepID=UPI0026303FB1|nr:hypothetical protein [Pseudonocardia sp.]